MIAMLTGRLVGRDLNRGILDVRGVGYEVFATNAALDAWAATDDEICAHVSTQVREDAITLYAFADDAQRLAFLALLTVSGVGPKVGLSSLDTLGADGLARAVAADDIRAISTIPGVGKKTAQRIALELKGKLQPSTGGGPVTVPVPTPKSTDPLPLALARLGYTKTEIDRALQGLRADGIEPDVDVGDRLRRALQILSGN